MPRTLIVLFAVAAVLLAAWLYGAHRWQAGTRELRARLDAARLPVRPERVDFAELEGLPAPVQRYFRAVLEDGRPMLAGVRVRHAGTIDMSETGEPRWKPFTSDQKVVTRRPGFDWDARVAMLPGLDARVHDSYVAGEGLLQASLFGLLSVADLRGTGDMAQGELMRYFGEATWYPTALLPSQGVRWEAADERSARGTLRDGDLALTLLFEFDEQGLIESMRAESRGRVVGGRVVPTPWQARCWAYEVRSGMRVPIEAEVSWLLPEGPRPYWRGRITDIEYEPAVAGSPVR